MPNTSAVRREFQSDDDIMVRRQHESRDQGSLWGGQAQHLDTAFQLFAKGFLAVVRTRKKISDFRPNTYNIP